MWVSRLIVGPPGRDPRSNATAARAHLHCLQKFDSQLLDRLLRANTGEPGTLPLLDEASNADEALQRLMAGNLGLSSGYGAPLQVGSAVCCL